MTKLTLARLPILASSVLAPPESAKFIHDCALRTPWEDVSAISVLAAPLMTNPNRVRCPLCRRINTVTNTDGNQYQCLYDGCFGYIWEQNNEPNY